MPEREEVVSAFEGCASCRKLETQIAELKDVLLTVKFSQGVDHVFVMDYNRMAKEKQALEARVQELTMPLLQTALTTAHQAGIAEGREQAAKIAAIYGRKRLGCNCAPVDIGVGIQHEPYCGLPTAEDIATAIREEPR